MSEAALSALGSLRKCSYKCSDSRCAQPIREGRSDAVLKVGLGLKTTFEGLWSCLGTEEFLLGKVLEFGFLCDRVRHAPFISSSFIF